MPKIAKQFELEVTPERFVTACNDIELQELSIFLGKELKRREIIGNLPKNTEGKKIIEIISSSEPPIQDNDKLFLKSIRKYWVDGHPEFPSETKNDKLFLELVSWKINQNNSCIEEIFVKELIKAIETAKGEKVLSTKYIINLSVMAGEGNENVLRWIALSEENKSFVKTISDNFQLFKNKVGPFTHYFKKLLKEVFTSHELEELNKLTNKILN